MASTPTRPARQLAVQAAALAAAAALVGAACAPDEVDEPAPELPDETETTEPPEEPTEPVEEPTEAPEAGVEEGQEEPGEDPDGATRLDGTASTEARSDDGAVGVLAVTDVRVGTHEGFDRVVFELAGDGVAVWNVRYVDEATAAGSGEPIDVDGEAILAVGLSNLTLPPDLPDDIQRWDEGRVDGAGGVIVEVVEDTIFEGVQGFFVGLEGEQPFLIERFDDPQRVVIDVVHDG